MKQVKQRTILVLLLVLLLAGGVILFCVRYVTHGAAWAAFSANSQAFTDNHLARGLILDRSGTVLYDPASGSYNDATDIREATLHAVGDPDTTFPPPPNLR